MKQLTTIEQEILDRVSSIKSYRTTRSDIPRALNPDLMFGATRQVEFYKDDETKYRIERQTPQVPGAATRVVSVTTLPDRA